MLRNTEILTDLCMALLSADSTGPLRTEVLFVHQQYSGTSAEDFGRG